MHACIIKATPTLVGEAFIFYLKNCEFWRNFQRRSTLRHQRFKMQQDISTLKQTRKSAMIALRPCLVKFGPRTPENRPHKVPHPIKLDGENVRYRE